MADPAKTFADLLDLQVEAVDTMLAAFAPPAAGAGQWAESADKLQHLWREFYALPARGAEPPRLLLDPAEWLAAFRGVAPFADPEAQAELWRDGMALWGDVLGQYERGGDPQLPRTDRRFADPRWRDQPLYALIHQTYLLFAERIEAMAGHAEGLTEEQRDQLRFATRTMLDAMSPDHFPLLNPVVVERTLETHGENLVKGMEHLAADLERGQLTHSTPDAFKLGETIAATPGKVVFETPLFQLIQYAPATDEVLAVPLVIFPPWINRFYILDLNPKKSFVKWAVDQGLTVFMISWKSADESMAEVTWDDYVRAQIAAIDHIRERLEVPAVHAIGYCVAGTTLAATLAVLARRGEASKVASATFFTAQVDFSAPGDLKLFVDDAQLGLIEQASQAGFLDGRYMAATFNLLRGNDLIWSYVVNNYLLGEEYPSFDLLHWNGDVTNLPAKWHLAYLRDLYRDNRLVEPDALSADGTPIDLARVQTPAYVQAGREDHIAPAGSVFRMLEHLAGPARFVLAGSGHIAGVVNPPAAQKYQYWTNDAACGSFDAFVGGATEHKGSWWPDWLQWLTTQDGARVPVKGKRKPGEDKSDAVIEDAPGRYVRTR
ncbi:MAG TPA: class I poly(R)-hydroxyalkanoic acid synthase [Croceibacterium sp.]|nr:class I poly(R)-hydroxyalkanoic acid synthase [Croceibacterium sp.]